MDVLEVKNLSKKYGQMTAVNDISFELGVGEILGFLGPNGAGKTTTLQMLVGALTPTAGQINYFGKSLFKHREEILDEINYSTTYTNLPWNLTVKECLHFISYLYSIKNRKKRLEEIIETFKLEPLLKQSMASLSAGQRTRVNLAKAFINHPKVLLLDEPTASLDPDIAKYLRAFILKEREEYKVSIVFTSHNMHEVEEICDRVIIINGGKLIANDTPIKLARKIDTTQIELLPDNSKDLQDYCQLNKIKFEMNGKYLTITTKENNVATIIQELSNKNISFGEISINKPSLEDYFLKISMGELL